MLRAARFAAKLGFDIDPDTTAPIPGLANLIDGVPPARLFDEFGKLFQAGFALESFRYLSRLGLLEHLFPSTAAWLADDRGETRRGFVESALQNTDQRVAVGKPVTPMFLFGVFLWGPVSERAAALVASDGLTEVQALVAAASQLVAEQNQRITLPKRFSYPMREVLQIQPRFERRRGSRAQNLLSHRHFRAAYDLMLLRVALGEVDDDTAAWWTTVQTLTAAEQRREFGIHRRRKPRRRVPTPSIGSP
jgi:poly(A) polymerase